MIQTYSGNHSKIPSSIGVNRNSIIVMIIRVKDVTAITTNSWSGWLNTDTFLSLYTGRILTPVSLSRRYLNKGSTL